MSAKRAQEPRLRKPMSSDQRAKLAEAMRNYVANDDRWPAHRQKLAEAQLARKITLYPEEVEAITKLRKKGRTFAYIAEEFRVCKEVLTRELAAMGVPTGHVKPERRAKQGRGFWRSFDPA